MTIRANMLSVPGSVATWKILHGSLLLKSNKEEIGRKDYRHEERICYMKSTFGSILRRIIRKPDLHSISERDLELLTTVKRDLLPENYVPRERFVPHTQIGTAGVSLNVESQLKLLSALQAPDMQALFQLLRNSEDINVGFGGKDFKNQGLIHNGYYPTPDAEIYAAMISSARPNKIIEVGSGYSTLIARATIKHIGLDCEIHVIDPQPRRSIEDFADHIEYKAVEHSSLANNKLSENTLLFIDSSHICRSRGDLPFLYCELLPKLPAGVLVHIHDIFIPFDYPDNYFRLFYTEEYLLLALLSHSSQFEVVLATHYLSRQHKNAMQAIFGPAVGENDLFFGASFWIRSR
jgi:hypothetical protein